MNLLNPLRILNSIKHYFADVGRTRTRLALLARGQDFLTAHGFSQELLQQGNDAWPWRVDGRTAESPIAIANDRAATPIADEPRHGYAKAIAALNAFSDAELQSLGISPKAIEQVIRRGGPAPEQPADEPAKRLAA